ncbi:hypothetical protein Pla52o_57110 [Novipirellula galeiformis]|uniref:Uncharacterized protein n=1 Tax=Novipirellula galeiformis TaxID=2528004 RepID=A0A5C6BFD1_9BACT|nr:hypothetical protein Pla52o_57110 [Novipirellula galeiformis]
MFGIGPMELLIVLIVGVLTIGIPICIVVLLVLLLRKQNNASGDSPQISQLQQENQRLRDELATLKRTSEG